MILEELFGRFWATIGKSNMTTTKLGILLKDMNS